MAEQPRFTTTFEPENFHAVYDAEEVQRIVEMIKSDLKIDDRFSFLRNYKKCFIASEFVTQVQGKLGWTRAQGTFFGRLLHQKDVIHNATSQKSFSDDDEWWRFQCDEESNALNWKQIVKTECTGDPLLIVVQLFEDILQMVHSALAGHSRVTNSQQRKYLEPERIVALLKPLCRLPAFQNWEMKLCILQRIKLEFDPNQSVAFWLNLYNMLCIHSIIYYAKRDVDPISSYTTRRTFFNTHTYLINERQFTLDDIEHGVLRCNNDYFKTDDPRLAFRVAVSDARIFSVLTCYNKSSPFPIIIPDNNISSVLDYAEQKFFKRHTLIRQNTIFIPKLCSWYAKEYKFKDNRSIINFLIEVLTLGLPETTKEIEALSRLDFSNCCVKYVEYDWQLFIDPATFHPFAATLPSLLETQIDEDDLKDALEDEEQMARWKISGNSSGGSSENFSLLRQSSNSGLK